MLQLIKDSGTEYAIGQKLKGLFESTIFKIYNNQEYLFNCAPI